LLFTLTLMIKRCLDVVLSLLLIALLSPVFIFIFFLVRATSSGPAIFCQRRLGQHGKPFTMYKFRSMKHNSEYSGTGLFTYADDPRITPIGRLLRSSSLDEIPQLFNVLIGSMSLVGPRPPTESELGPWSEFTPYMKQRFQVPQGMTGFSQILSRNDLNWDEKVAYDNIYVLLAKKYGPCVDLFILFCTFFSLFDRSNLYVIPPSDPFAEGPISRIARSHSTGT